MSQLYLVYKGESSDDLYTATFNGNAWHGNTKIKDQPGGIAPQSNYNPGVTVFQDNLFLVYKGANSNTLYTATYNGSNWHGNTKIANQPGGIDPESNYNPGVTVFNKNLYIVYKGAHSNTLYTAFFDGEHWFGNTPIENQPGGINPESNYNPGVAVFNGKLYIVYKGAQSNDLYTAWFDGKTWFGNTKIANQDGGINPKSNYNPGVAVYNGLLYLVYKGESSDDLYTATFDGNIWHGNTKIANQPGGIAPQSNYNPGVTVFENELFLVYKGKSSNDLYTAGFDGENWFGNTKIEDQPGDINPKSNYNPGVAVY